MHTAVFERRTLDCYQFGEKLGKGSYGTVYQAVNLKNGTFVAIKEIELSLVPKKNLPEIKNEVELLKKLDHPNVVKIFSQYITEMYLFIVLEYVENGSLWSILTKFGIFPEELVVIYIRQVLQGLVYLHQHSIIHRDIKSSNILICKDGHVVLADFGTAIKVIPSGEENRSDVQGSPYWLAPEVIMLETPTYKVDIWAVGATIIELLTGEPPYFQLNQMNALFRIVQDEHPPLPQKLSSEATKFLLCCFKKDPDLRFSAHQLLSHPWLYQKEKTQSFFDLQQTIKVYNTKKRTSNLAEITFSPPTPEKKEIQSSILEDLIIEKEKDKDIFQTLQRVEEKLQFITLKLKIVQMKRESLQKLETILTKYTKSNKTAEFKDQVIADCKKMDILVEELLSYKKVINKQIDQLKICLPRGTAFEDYIAKGKNQINLKVGDEVLIFEKEEGKEFWRGELVSTGEQGLFPSSIVLLQDSLLSPESKDLKKNHTNDTLANSQNVIEKIDKYKVEVDKKVKTITSTVPTDLHLEDSKDLKIKELQKKLKESEDETNELNKKLNETIKNLNNAEKRNKELQEQVEELTKKLKEKEK